MLEFSRFRIKTGPDLVCFKSNLGLIYFGPGGFACTTRGGVAMRRWPLLLPTFGLSFSLLRLLLLTHFGESPKAENLFPPIFWHNQKILVQACLRAPPEVAFAMRSWPLLLPSVSLSLSLLFTSSCCLHSRTECRTLHVQQKIVK